jgi:hypothetical protein
VDDGSSLVPPEDELLRKSRRFPREAGEIFEVGTHHVGVNRPTLPFTIHMLRGVEAGSFHEISRLEGNVLERNGDVFTARLVDLNGGHSDEEAEFSIEEVQKCDRDLAVPGAVFYWTVGFWDSLLGLRSRVSQICFRRLPVWDEFKLKKAKLDAESLGKLFEE